MVSSATPLRNSPTSYLPRRLGAITPMLLSAALAFLLFAAPAALAAPANDNFASAEAVSALPLSHVVDTAGGTTEEGEPQFCSSVDNSAWYAITPSEDAILSADASGTWPPAQINVYRQDASGLGGLSFLACQNWSSEPVVFRVQAGSTYYLQASTLYSPSGQLRVNVDEVQAPANDNFGDATPISSVPFGDDLDLLGASAQPSEPTDCIGTDQKTAWYAFTPSRTDSYAVERSGGRGYLPLAVYTGQSLSSLSQVACAGYSTAIFRAEAGKTYYLQLGHGYGSGSFTYRSTRRHRRARASITTRPIRRSSTRCRSMTTRRTQPGSHPGPGRSETERPRRAEAHHTATPPMATTRRRSRSQRAMGVAPRRPARSTSRPTTSRSPSCQSHNRRASAKAASSPSVSRTHATPRRSKSR